MQIRKVNMIISFMVFVLLMNVNIIHGNQKETQNTGESDLCKVLGPPSYPRFPITSDYFQGILDSTNEFSQIELIYYMNIAPGHHEVRKQNLTIWC